jgi:hypothetical protein
MLRGFVVLLLLLPTTLATVTLSTSFRPGIVFDASTGTMNALAHSAPIVMLTGAGDLTLNGLAAGVNGEVVTVLRDATSGTLTVVHNAWMSASNPIVITNELAGNPVVSQRAGFKFIFYSPYWFMLSDAV